MTNRALLTSLLAFSLLSAPVSAQARTSSPTHETEDVAGRAWIPWAIALVVIAVVVVLVARDNKPASP